MAQQTQMATVAPYYARFIRRFPSPAALAEAEQDEVLKAWQGLGYYARARHLHAAASQIVDRHGGRVPESVTDLRNLSGVGPYTAGAVASLAFGIAEPAVDGNARRVLSRLYDLSEPTPARLDGVARLLIDSAGRPAAINQAIMDFGGAVCVPRNPSCQECPVLGLCAAARAGTVADRPPPKTRGAIPARTSSAAIVRREGRVLFVRRPERGLLGGLWDLPGTDPVPHAAANASSSGTEPAAALSSHLLQTHGLRVRMRDRAATIRHTFSHFRLRLDVWRADWVGGDPPADSVYIWAGPSDVEALAVPTYLRSIVPSLVEGDS